MRNTAKEVGRKQSTDQTERTRTAGIIGATTFFLLTTLLT